MSVTELAEKVIALSTEERSEFLATILDGLAEADPTDNGRDSLTEAKIRSAEIRSGKIKPISQDDFMQAFEHLQ